MTNIILPEVYNLSKLKKLTRLKVAKDKRTSVFFDQETQQFVGLDAAQLKQLKEIYKGVDVETELKKMSLWLLTPKGKRRSGNIGFILHWLGNASPSKSPTPSEFYDLCESDTPLRSLLDEYLQDLWQGREHILQFNMIKRPS